MKITYKNIRNIHLFVMTMLFCFAFAVERPTIARTIKMQNSPTEKKGFKDEDYSSVVLDNKLVTSETFSGFDPTTDSDGVRVPNYLDLDSDNDGIQDCADTHTNPVVFHLYAHFDYSFLHLYKQNEIQGSFVCPHTQCHTNYAGELYTNTNIPKSDNTDNLAYDDGKYYVINNAGNLLYTDDIIAGNFTSLGNANIGSGGYKNLGVDNGVFYHWRSSGSQITLYSSTDPVNTGWTSIGTVNGRSLTYMTGGRTYHLRDIAVHESVFYFYYFNDDACSSVDCNDERTLLFRSTTPLSATPNWQNLGTTLYGNDVYNIAIGSQDLKALAPPVQDLDIQCPSSTIDLATAHTGTTPPGYSLRWFTNNSHTGMALNPSQIANVAEGTYYAFYYNSSLNCYSPAAEVVVTKENCDLDCLPNSFLSQGGQLYDIQMDTNPFTFVPIGPSYDEQFGYTGAQYNGLGFNPVDGYLYAMRQGSGVGKILLKIHPATGVIQELGEVSGIVQAAYLNGDFDESGNYYIKAGNINGMWKVDVVNLTATPIIFSPAGNYNSSDFTYNIKDGLLYASRSISGQGTQLYTIDPSNGNISDVGTPHLPGLTFGAMFSDSEGKVFGAVNGGGLYQFNTTNGEKTLISDSPSSANNDGAHCLLTPIQFGADPYVTKTNPETTYIPGQPTVYTVTVGNNGPFGILGVSVTDLVPAGIPASNVSYTAVTAGGASTNVSGTQIGPINDEVNLPVGGTVTYTVTVSVPTTFTGELTNTVNLTISDASSYDTDLTNNEATVTLEEPISHCFTGNCNENAFLFTSDPNTLEYDNLISGFHSTIAKQQDGNYLIWGQGAKPNTFGEHLYAPTLITPDNGFNYTGEILKAALGTRGATNDGSDQYAILTTDGLYIWGGGDPISARKDGMVHRTVKDSQTFDKMTNANIPNANEYGLPQGVNPEDVKMMFGSFATLGIVTCMGEAYVLSHKGNKNGDGTADSTSEYNKWHKVSVSEGVPLRKVVAMRGTPGAMMALTSDGKIYTWGTDTYLGDGTDKANRLYASEMTLPAGVVPKMIGMTKAGSTLFIERYNSYYLLSTTGEVYSLGDNSKKQLGTFDTAERTTWVNVKSTDASTNMTNIVWISPNEHDNGGHATVTALTSDGKLWGWGMNHGNMLGVGGDGAVDPRYMFGGLDHDEKVLAIETGGHINTLFKDCDFKLGYIGHSSNGSYATYSSSSGSNSPYFQFNGAKLTNLCAIYTPPYPELIDLTSCPGSTFDLMDALQNTVPTGYNLEWWTTIDRQDGTQITDVSEMAIGTYYAFFISDEDECQLIEGEEVVASYYEPTDEEYESCVCYRDPVISGSASDTQVGISLIKGRENLQSSDNWPQSRKSGFIALESNKQGMVVTRIAKTDLGNIVSPQEGMMVYDTTDKCLKIYSDDEWKCFATPACP